MVFWIGGFSGTSIHKNASNIATGLPHSPCDHLLNHDPPFPTNSQIRQPLRLGLCRSGFLHTMAVSFCCGSELEWDREV
jgi:hypothetical protein